MSNFPLKLVAIVIAALIAILTAIIGTTHQDAQNILVAQSAGGTLTVYNQAGWHWLPLSRVTEYPRREQYEFNAPIRFNDGGTAKMVGSIQFEVPSDEKTLIDLHSKFGSADTLKAQLVERVVDKAIFMSGPLMSSRESYAERKAELVSDVEDQINHGIFQTRQKDIQVEDPITGSKKTVTAVEVVLNDKGQAMRQEEPVLPPFGIKTFGFTIKEIVYDPTIEKQITQQQQITMDVQTAIANSKKAEQAVLTTTKEGQANAAKAEWEQKTLNAKDTALAEKDLAVAKLRAQQAEQEKQALILKAEGESEYKRKVFAADGALQQKLQAYVQVAQANAKAIADFKGNLVPSVVMGQGGNSTNSAQDLLNMLNAKTARDLSLDMSLPQQNK